MDKASKFFWNYHWNLTKQLAFFKVELEYEPRVLPHFKQIKFFR
jgi:hypothetical protein